MSKASYSTAVKKSTLAKESPEVEVPPPQKPIKNHFPRLGSINDELDSLDDKLESLSTSANIINKSIDDIINSQNARVAPNILDTKTDSSAENPESEQWSVVQAPTKAVNTTKEKSLQDQGANLLLDMLKKNKNICRHWYCTNKCPYGSSCKFHHPKINMQNASDPSVTQSANSNIIDKFAKEIKDLKNHIKELKRQMESLTTEKKQLQNNSDEKERTHSDTIKVLNDQISNMKTKASEQKEEFDLLNTKYESLLQMVGNSKLTSIDDLKKKIIDLEHALQLEKTKENTYKLLYTKIKQNVEAKISIELDSHKKSILDSLAASKYNFITEKYEDQINVLKNTIKNLDKNAQHRDAECKKFEDKCSKLENDNKSLSVKNSDLSKQISSYQKEFLTLQSIIAEHNNDKIYKIKKATTSAFDQMKKEEQRLIEIILELQKKNVELYTENQLFIAEINNKKRVQEIISQNIRYNKVADKNATDKGISIISDNPSNANADANKDTNVDLAASLLSNIFPEITDTSSEIIDLLHVPDDIKINDIIATALRTTSSEHIDNNILDSHFIERDTLNSVLDLDAKQDTQDSKQVTQNKKSSTSPNTNTKIEWYWMDGNTEHPYNQTEQTQIESIYQSYLKQKASGYPLLQLHYQLDLSIVHQSSNTSVDYLIDVKDMTQTNKNTNYVRSIDRKIIDLDKLNTSSTTTSTTTMIPSLVLKPKFLTKSPVPIFISSDKNTFITVSSNEENYIRDLFYSNGFDKKAKITSITKQINKKLALQYSLMKDAFRKDSIIPNEIFAFHGSHATDPNILINSGVNTLYANDGYLGRAFYMTQNMTYVSTRYSHGKYNGNKYIRQVLGVYALLGNVLIENGRTASNTYTTPAGYHSRSLDADGATIYGIYNPAQVLCTYIITYEDI